MHRPLIIGIVGEKNSGKSIVFKYLKTKRGFFSARCSDVLSGVLRILGLDPNDREQNLARLAEALRSTFGPGVIPFALLKEGRRSGKRVIVIEGMRRLAELAVLRRLPGFRLLFITAPARARWEWARKRALRKDDSVSFKRFVQIERTLITEREIPNIGKLADVRIENAGTKHELFRKVDDAVSRFMR